MKPRQHTAQRRAFTLVEMMIVVLVIAILIAIAAPNFAQAREKARTISCVANLRRIESAKDQWLMFFHKPRTEEPTMADLIGPVNFIKSEPICPSNGTYTINDGMTLAECSYGGTHVIDP